MSYDSNVVAAYRLENNGNDSQTGANTLTATGVPRYSNTTYIEGAYSHYNLGDTNNKVLTAANGAAGTVIGTAFRGSATGWTIEFYSRKHLAAQPVVIGKGATNSAGCFWFTMYTPSEYAPYGTSFTLKWNGNNDKMVYTWNPVTQLDTWFHIAITYSKSDDRTKVYVNNALQYNAVHGQGDPFSTTGAGDNIRLLWSDHTSTTFNGFIDNVIFSKVVRTSFPTPYLSDVTVSGCSSPKFSAGGQIITVTGTGFMAGAVVKINGLNLTTTFISATTLTAVTQATTAGTYDVIVTNTDTGTGTLTNGIIFIDAPVLISCLPTGANTGGGTSVTLTGTGFLTGAAVTFGGTAATAVSVISLTSITCACPAHAAGVVDIKLTNTDTQASTLAGAFTYYIYEVTGVTPANSGISGGGIVTITGGGFTAGTVIYFDGVAIPTTFLNTNILQISPPHHTAGEVIISAVDGVNVATWAYNFIYITSAPDGYTVLLNGKDITAVQIKRFIQKNEINFINSSNLSFNNIDIIVPFDAKNVFYKDSNDDIVTIKQNGVAVFKGFISAKEKDYSTNNYNITASQLLSAASKTNVKIADTISTPPVQRLLSLITDFLPPDYIMPKTTGLDGLFEGVTIQINTGTNDTKLLDVILTLCEMLDIAIYIDDKLNINLIPLPLQFQNGVSILPTLTTQPKIKELKEYYYDAVSFTYKTAPEATEAIITAGTGETVLNTNYSNIYITAASAQSLANRKLLLRERVYSEAEFILNKQITINIGDNFIYDNYNFICVSKEETLSDYKIKGIGVEI